MSHISFWSGLGGGALIGAAAILLLWCNGRVAGVSGIAAGLWTARGADRSWRWLFLIGLVVGASAFALLIAAGPVPRSSFPPVLIAASGLLVGYGTSMAGGCTSGHGVCGLARLSVRSLAASLIFFVVAMLIAVLARHLFGIA